MIFRSLYIYIIFDEYKSKNIVFKKKTNKLFFDRISIIAQFLQIFSDNKMDFMIGIEQELLFFMNPSVIEKNKVFFDGFFKYPQYILIF